MLLFFRFLYPLMIALLLVSGIVPVAAVFPSSPVIDFEILNLEEMNNSSKAVPINAEIQQGEQAVYSHYVERTDTLFEVSLQWDKTNGNVLQMIIHPSSESYIILNDEDDGILNGFIAARPTLPEDVTGTTWRVIVEGLQVDGSQSYTLIINSV